MTTEKDAVRLAFFESYFEGIPIAYLPIEVKFQGKTNFNDLILKYVEQNRVDSKFSKSENTDFTPEVGIILGTGLGGLIQKIDIKYTLAYEDIPNFPVSMLKAILES